MAVKMNLRIITKNHTVDPEIGFLAKSISKSNGFVTAMPTARELSISYVSEFFNILLLSKFVLKLKVQFFYGEIKVFT